MNKNIINNAIDFLQKSVSELEESPKYSVLHFHAALELFLKARLIKEHWSLVFAQSKHIDKNKFASGDFISVSFSDAIERINKLSNQPELTPKVIESFEKIGKIRNTIIHFYYDFSNDESVHKIKQAQLVALYHIHYLFVNKWNAIGLSPDVIDIIYSELKKLREYLEIVYTNKKDDIAKLTHEGYIFDKCPSCLFDSMRHEKEAKDIYQAVCIVCEYTENSFNMKCECDNIVFFYGGGFSTCTKCKKEFENEDMAKSLNGDYHEINCHICDNRAGAVDEENGNYRCAGCFNLALAHEINECECCGECYTGERKELDFHFGCGFYPCEGVSGIHGRDDFER